MVLPPCHMMAQFYVTNDNELSCQMYQRSVDAFLGLPFNIASYALFTHMIAQVCGYRAKELIINMGDVHLYKNHIEQANIQLAREHLSSPSLVLNPDVKEIDKFTMNDIHLLNYKSHGIIKAEMAV
jgi:thymidylate synthase